MPACAETEKTMNAKLTPNGRLLQLARTLRSVVPMERFVMDEWVCRAGGGSSETPHSDDVQTLVDETGGECGFAGCAIGWASTDPVLVAEGFETRHGQPTGGWDTVQGFFDLNQDEAHNLFTRDGWADWYNATQAGGAIDYVGGDYHPTPAEVATRIEWFVAQNHDGNFYKD